MVIFKQPLCDSFELKKKCISVTYTKKKSAKKMYKSISSKYHKSIYAFFLITVICLVASGLFYR